jgi:hypothetical protein
MVGCLFSRADRLRTWQNLIKYVLGMILLELTRFKVGLKYSEYEAIVSDHSFSFTVEMSKLPHAGFFFITRET